MNALLSHLYADCEGGPPAIYLPTIIIIQQKRIPANAFIGCTALKDVYYTGTDAEWGSITIASEGNAFINNAKKHFKYKYE